MFVYNYHNEVLSQDKICKRFPCETKFISVLITITYSLLEFVIFSKIEFEQVWKGFLLDASFVI